MRICNFNASPSPGKLPKHSHPQTSVPIRSLALPPPVPSCLLILSLFFFFSVLPRPPPPPPLHLHRLLRNAITPRATPYAQQPNPPTPQRSYISVRLAVLARAIHPIPPSSPSSQPRALFPHSFAVIDCEEGAGSFSPLDSFISVGYVCLKPERERERLFSRRCIHRFDAGG